MKNFVTNVDSNEGKNYFCNLGPVVMVRVLCSRGWEFEPIKFICYKNCIVLLTENKQKEDVNSHGDRSMFVELDPMVANNCYWKLQVGHLCLWGIKLHHPYCFQIYFYSGRNVSKFLTKFMATLFAKKRLRTRMRTVASQKWNYLARRCRGRVKSEKWKVSFLPKINISLKKIVLLQFRKFELSFGFKHFLSSKAGTWN